MADSQAAMVSRLILDEDPVRRLATLTEFIPRI